MGQAQPLVSICIPTYNAGQYLKKQLDSLVTQPEFLDGRVEVVISDNCSSDDTQQICTPYANKYENLIYHREMVNTGNGGNTNFRTVMNLAHGQLLKLVNADFLFNSDALAFFCEAVEKCKARKPQCFFSCGCGLNIREKVYGKFVDTDQFMHMVGYWVTWIGTFSMWKEDFDKYKDDEAGFKHLFWHIEETMDVLREKNLGWIDDRIFGRRQPLPEKDVSYNLYHNFYENLSDTLRPFRDDGTITQACYEWMQKDLMVRFFPWWMVAQEYNVSGYKFNQNINLKDVILNACKDRPYYQEVLAEYQKERDKLLARRKTDAEG